MGSRENLFAIADSQEGYFTTQQALESGFSRSNFHLKLRSGEWEREERGIYRLSHYPVGERPELVLWTLWSCNRQGTPQGVWSHATALDIHDLSDIMPAKMHMTVPKRFRRSAALPEVLRLHFADLEDNDFECRRGYYVTTPLRTLWDVMQEGVIQEGLLMQAVHQALARRMVSYSALMDLGKKDAQIYSTLAGIMR